VHSEEARHFALAEGSAIPTKGPLVIVSGQEFRSDPSISSITTSRGTHCDVIPNTGIDPALPMRKAADRWDDSASLAERCSPTVSTVPVQHD
jgi:hypothetical protein